MESILWVVSQLVHDLFLGLILVGSFYLFALTLVALWEERRPGRLSQRKESGSFQHRFVVIVPAHNEEMSIQGTLNSLRALDYPKGRFHILVVADNCDDRTAELSHQHGVEVLERRDTSKRGKGYALRFAFSELLKNKEWEACVVIDADSVITENALMVLNDVLNSGANVCQLNDQIEPVTGSWSSEITRLGFFLYNYIRPLGKKALGFPVGLRGNGMCFRRHVVETHSWEAFSLAEDLEYGLQLINQGEFPVFVPEATVIAKMPHQAGDAISQRRRWEMGRWPLLKSYSAKLLARPTLTRVETTVDLFIPPLAHFLFMMMIGFSIWAMILSSGYSVSHFSMAGTLWGTSFTLFFGHIILGLASRHADPGLRRALIHAPAYMLWKMGVYLQTLIKGRDTEWIRTIRR